MYESDERIATELLMDDLGALVSTHADIASAYRVMAIQSHSVQLLPLVERFATEHAMHVGGLLRFVYRYGGSSPVSEKNGPLSRKVKSLARGMSSDGAIYGMMRSAEQKLSVEYEKRMRSLGAIAELQSVLYQNYESGTRRLNIIENLLGREQRYSTSFNNEAPSSSDWSREPIS